MAMNHLYDEKSILKSENRVFSTIMFTVSINRNPITIMETIECAMCKFLLLWSYAEFIQMINKIVCLVYNRQDLPSLVNPDSLWEHAVLFMDLVYLNLEAVYKSLWKHIHGQEYGFTQSFALDRYVLIKLFKK